MWMRAIRFDFCVKSALMISVASIMISVRPRLKNMTKKKERHDSHISNWTAWAKWSSETLKRGRDKPARKQRLKGRPASFCYLLTHTSANWAQRSGKLLWVFSRSTISSYVFDIKEYLTLIFKVKFLCFQYTEMNKEICSKQIQKTKGDGSPVTWTYK